jgi:hypothetical protein
MTNRLLILFLVVSVLVLVIGGAIGSYLSFQYVSAAMQSLEWQRTDGRVLVTSIEVQRNHSARSLNAVNRANYVPEITYLYTVDGETYEGSRIAFNELHSYDTRDQAQAIIDDFERQPSLDVYYDPDDPGNTVLIRGSTWQSYTPLLISITAFLLGSFTSIMVAKSYLGRHSRRTAAANL